MILGQCPLQVMSNVTGYLRCYGPPECQCPAIGNTNVLALLIINRCMVIINVISHINTLIYQFISADCITARVKIKSIFGTSLFVHWFAPQCRCRIGFVSVC